MRSVCVKRERKQGSSEGLAFSAKDQTGGDIASDAPLYIGDRFAGGCAFAGRIDEVGIYNQALDEDERQQNYRDEGLAVEPSGKQSAHWGDLKSTTYLQVENE